MSEWQFYSARGIVKDYSFDSAQIEKGLEIDLFPEIKISPEHLTDRIQRDFAAYAKRRGLKGLELGASIEPSPEKFEESLSRLEEYLIWIRGANDAVSEHLIDRINFHVGSVLDYESERLYKKIKKISNASATFDAEEHLKTLATLRELYKRIDEIGAKYKITILVENMPNPDFAKADSFEEKRTKYPYTDRLSKTFWLPEPFEHGNIATANEINYTLNGTQIKICYDLEHLKQTIESSRKNIAEGHLEPSTKAEERLYEEFGLLVRKNEPIRFKSILDLEQQINSLINPIESSQIGGQVQMAFLDGDGYLHIGSQMPLTPNNMYIKDEKVREKMWQEGREYVKKALKILKSKGCRRITFEVFPYDYTGDDWVRMTQETFDNVKQILSEI